VRHGALRRGSGEMSRRHAIDTLLRLYRPHDHFQNALRLLASAGATSGLDCAQAVAAPAARAPNIVLIEELPRRPFASSKY